MYSKVSQEKTIWKCSTRQVLGSIPSGAFILRRWCCSSAVEQPIAVSASLSVLHVQCFLCFCFCFVLLCFCCKRNVLTKKKSNKIDTHVRKCPRPPFTRRAQSWPSRSPRCFEDSGLWGSANAIIRRGTSSDEFECTVNTMHAA